MSHSTENHKASRRPYAAMLAILVVVLGIVVVIYPRRRDAGIPAKTEDSRGDDHRVKLAPPSNREVLPPANQEEQGPDHDKPPSLIRVARPRMLEAHPDVAEFREIEHKVLRSTAEQLQRREMLADVARIRHARDRLLATREGPLTREDELERLYRVEFLAAAIEDPHNQALPEVFLAIKDVILADNILDDLPLDLRRSLSGDKMELYMALLHDAPEQAALIAAQVQGTPLESLIRYAGQRYQVWTSPKTGEPQ